MFSMIAMKTAIIVPGIVPHFFCDGTAGVFGNATGGRKGCITGSLVYGILTSFLPLLLLNFLGNMDQANSTFFDLDLLVEAVGLGLIGRYGSIVMIITSLGLFLAVLFVK